jgi:Family of unknown function (DUF6081)
MARQPYRPVHATLAERFALMTQPNILFKDDFRRGLDLTGTWVLLSRPPSFVADDGVVSASDQGLHVKAAGTNPLTGEPAFSKTLPGSAEDHVKWMADTQYLSSNSTPRQLNCGMALFTLLDGGLPPAKTGLVSLEPPYAFPTAFAGGPNLFGQGAELRVERFEITSVNES